MATTSTLPLSTLDYQVGAFCPIGVEVAPLRAILDEVHPYPQQFSSQNNYILGKIAGHNIAIAILPETGNNKAAATATQLRNDFPAVQLAFLVGIGGGIPDLPKRIDIRLGDIAVSMPTITSPGVIQYDMGKETDSGFQRTGTLNKPPQLLLSAAKRLFAQQEIEESILQHYSKMISKYPRMKEAYAQPRNDEDLLFDVDYQHPGGLTCENCDLSRLIPRPTRHDMYPRIHHGTIGSANMVMKRATRRDQLREHNLDIICVDMEAAGLMDTIPCLVIRGICDYADSHKNKKWQPYAAAIAAAYLKGLLLIIPPATDIYSKATSLILKNSIDLGDHKIEQVSTAQKSALLNSLAFAESSDRFNEIQDPHRSTCEWVHDFDRSGYPEWSQNPASILWIVGKPGSGKSVLLKHLLSKTQVERQDESCVAGFFYNGLGLSLEHSIEGMMRSLLIQLLPQYPPSFIFPLRLFEQKEKTRSGGQVFRPTRWTFTDLRLMLISTIKLASKYQPVILFLDALDECEGPIIDIIEFLQDFFSEIKTPQNKIQICATMRSPGALLSRTLNGSILALDNYVVDDISAYTKSLLAPFKHVFDSGNEQGALHDLILAKANGLFLWVSLVIKSLRKGLVAGDTASQMMRMIDSMPEGLSDLYRYSVERIESIYRSESKLMLLIVHAAKCPLTLQEFQSILTLDGNCKSTADSIPSSLSTTLPSNSAIEAKISGRCGGLLELRYNNVKDSHTLHFIHQSVSEFLQQELPNGKQTSLQGEKPEVTISTGDETLFKCCLLYLVVSDLQILAARFILGRSSADELNEVFREHPLLEYAVKYWTDHWKTIDDLGGPECDTSFEQLLYWIDLPSWIWIFNLCNDSWIDHPLDTHLLTIAIEAGALNFVSANNKHLDLNLPNGRFGFPLTAACALGNQSMVEYLLELGADINANGGRFESALQAASIMGHDSVVVLLVRSGASIDACGSRFGTALHGATRQDDADIVHLLLQHGANPNIVFGSEGSPLHIAASRDLRSIVTLLLKFNADTDILDKDGWPPVACAQLHKNKDVLRLLSSSRQNDFSHPIGISPKRMKVIGPSSNITLTNDGLHLSSEGLMHATAVRSDHCMPIGRYTYYFEARILSAGEASLMGIGFCILSPDMPTAGMPGWTFGTCGYHGDNGEKLIGDGKVIPYGPPYGQGDVIGCGLDFRNMSAFFTKNGRHLGVAFTNVDRMRGKLYPMIGIAERSVEIEVNFGQSPFVYDPAAAEVFEGPIQ